ncbi:MAG: flavin oxidoreductase, partial [Muribaculaceae bacterium]|nr:flavin oxidoreductase [Muribaculaceae bacterium]
FDVFPMTMICKVKEKLQESPTGCYLVAEIIDILCDEQFLGDDGKPDVSKMNLITFDPIHNKYIQLGKVIGNAFSDGKTLI